MIMAITVMVEVVIMMIMIGIVGMQNMAVRIAKVIVIMKLIYHDDERNVLAICP